MRCDTYKIPKEIAYHALLDCAVDGFINAVNNNVLSQLQTEWERNPWRTDNYCQKSFAESRENRLLLTGMQYKGDTIKRGKKFKAFVTFSPMTTGYMSPDWTPDGERMLSNEADRFRVSPDELRGLYVAFYAVAFNVMNGVRIDFPMEAVIDAYLTALGNPELASVSGLSDFERTAKKHYTRIHSMMFPSNYVNARSSYSADDFNVSFKLITVNPEKNSVGRPKEFYDMTMEQREKERAALLNSYPETRRFNSQFFICGASGNAAKVLYDGVFQNDAASVLSCRELVIKPRKCGSFSEFENSFIHDHPKLLRHAWDAYKLTIGGI